MRPIPEFTGANGYPVRHEPYFVTIPLGEWEDMTDELKRLREEAQGKIRTNGDKMTEETETPLHALVS